MSVVVQGAFQSSQDLWFPDPLQRTAAGPLSPKKTQPKTRIVRDEELVVDADSRTRCKAIFAPNHSVTRGSLFRDTQRIMGRSPSRSPRGSPRGRSPKRGSPSASRSPPRAGRSRSPSPIDVRSNSVACCSTKQRQSCLSTSQTGCSVTSVPRRPCFSQTDSMNISNDDAAFVLGRVRHTTSSKPKPSTPRRWRIVMSVWSPPSSGQCWISARSRSCG